MLNFDFLGKGLRIFLHHILSMIFQEKYFSCYIVLTDQTSLSDCLYILDIVNICTVNACFPGCGVIYFKNNVLQNEKVSQKFKKSFISK